MIKIMDLVTYSHDVREVAKRIEEQSGSDESKIAGVMDVVNGLGYGFYPQIHFGRYALTDSETLEYGGTCMPKTILMLSLFRLLGFDADYCTIERHATAVLYIGDDMYIVREIKDHVSDDNSMWRQRTYQPIVNHLEKVNQQSTERIDVLTDVFEVSNSEFHLYRFFERELKEKTQFILDQTSGEKFSEFMMIHGGFPEKYSGMLWRSLGKWHSGEVKADFDLGLYYDSDSLELSTIELHVGKKVYEGSDMDQVHGMHPVLDAALAKNEGYFQEFVDMMRYYREA